MSQTTTGTGQQTVNQVSPDSRGINHDRELKQEQDQVVQRSQPANMNIPPPVLTMGNQQNLPLRGDFVQERPVQLRAIPNNLGMILGLKGVERILDVVVSMVDRSDSHVEQLGLP